MSGLTAFLKSVGLGRLALIVGVTSGVAVALILIMARAGGEQRSLLYAGMTAADIGQVAQQLDQGGVRYELGPDGGSIFVARDQVVQARILVASNGALNSGTIGYEIFDESDALGATQFVQNVNVRRAAEGELARTIASIRGVTSARVHLVLPERRLFEREAGAPSATVMIGLSDPSMAAGHARTIRNLVASATQGLEPGRVTVVDEEGRTLANGSGAQDQLDAAVLDDRRAQTEERLRRKVLDALAPMVGENGARVQVAAEVDLTRMSTTNETFDPDGQVVRSRSVVEESMLDRDAADDTVTVSNNIPDGAVGAGTAPVSSSESNRLEETFNYEISRSTVTQVREAGEVTRLSVAVAVDQARVVGEDGTVSWRDRTPEELDQIAAVARAAVGLDQARGDVFQIASMPFDRPQFDFGAPAGGVSFDKNDILRFAEIGVMLVVGLALTVLVAAPLAKGLAQPSPMLAMAGMGALPAPGQPPRLAAPPAQEALPAPADDGEEMAQGVDFGALDGKLKASTVRRVSEVVGAHPEESLAILRTWMHER